MKLQGILLFVLLSLIFTNRIFGEDKIKILEKELNNIDPEALIILSLGLNFYLRDVLHVSIDFIELSKKSEFELKSFIIENARNTLLDFDNLINLPSKYSEEIIQVMGLRKFEDMLMPSKTFNI